MIGCNIFIIFILYVIKFLAPEDLAPPTAVSLTSTSVTLSWSAPATPNGVLTGYTVERWTDNSSVLLQTLSASLRSYVDEGTPLHPYTLYRYRISASTGSYITRACCRMFSREIFQ